MPTSYIFWLTNIMKYERKRKKKSTKLRKYTKDSEVHGKLSPGEVESRCEKAKTQSDGENRTRLFGRSALNFFEKS